MTQFKGGEDNNGCPRVLEFDFIRCVACFAVALLHVTSRFVANFSEPYSYSHGVITFISSSTRMAVPLFVMISGYFLLRKSYFGDDLKLFYKKRLSVIAIPFVFWALFYFIFFVALKLLSTQPLTYKTFISYFGSIALTGMAPNAVHLWYLYMLIGLYLVTPLISVWLNIFSRKYLTAATVVFLFLVCFSSLLSYAAHNPTRLPMPIIFVTYIPYFLLGKILGDALFRYSGSLCPILSFTAYLISTLGAAFSYMQTQDTFFFGNFSPFVYAQTISFFIFALTWRSNPLLKFKYLPYFANLSFGVYLVHIFYLTNFGIIFRKFNIFADSPIVYILLLTLLTYLLSNITTAVIKKIPYLRRVV